MRLELGDARQNLVLNEKDTFLLESHLQDVLSCTESNLSSQKEARLKKMGGIGCRETARKTLRPSRQTVLAHAKFDTRIDCCCKISYVRDQTSRSWTTDLVGDW